MLNNIKTLLNITDTSKDAILLLLIDRCTNELLAYTHNDKASRYQSLISSMVIFQYNRLGTEGLTSENYSGVSLNYSSEYPESITREMKSLRLITVW